MAKLKTVTVTRQKVEQQNISPKLEQAARVAMADVIGLKENEEVLITTNFGCDGFIIARALYDASISMKAKPVVVVQEKKNMFDFAERLVLETMRAEPDIVISVPSYVAGKDPYGVNIGYVGRDGKKYQSLMTKLLAGDRKIRSFWSPQVTVDMFERCVPIDYASMYKTAGKLASVLNKGQ